jgi:hypothetical protein
VSINTSSSIAELAIVNSPTPKCDSGFRSSAAKRTPHSEEKMHGETPGPRHNPSSQDMGASGPAASETRDIKISRHDGGPTGLTSEWASEDSP